MEGGVRVGVGHGHLHQGRAVNNGPDYAIVLIPAEEMEVALQRALCAQVQDLS